MKREWLARGMIILGLAIVLTIPAFGWWRNSQSPLVHARMAETGGWTPENFTVEAGKPLQLRLTSDDVTHGFAVGQADQPAVDIIPGEVTEVTLVFDKPGKYTYYCTRWCSLNHWRMRGTIEVTGSNTTRETVNPPLYIQLGLDIDADHQASVLPVEFPSVNRGAHSILPVPEKYTEREYYLTHTPFELWSVLRAEEGLDQLSDQQIWDLVAWTWSKNTNSNELQLGEELYTANCAACHGETGVGDGVFAVLPRSATGGEETSHSYGELVQPPADFTDPRRMLAASPAHLQGKIIRGGMGTGMPYWGPIFTEEQTWALVAYLWTFQFR